MQSMGSRVVKELHWFPSQINAIGKANAKKICLCWRERPSLPPLLATRDTKQWRALSGRSNRMEGFTVAREVKLHEWGLFEVPLSSSWHHSFISYHTWMQFWNHGAVFSTRECQIRSPFYFPSRRNQPLCQSAICRISLWQTGLGLKMGIQFHASR